jgi:hypothetical protein
VVGPIDVDMVRGDADGYNAIVLLDKQNSL